MHDLECNFGMGSPDMFYGPRGRNGTIIDRDDEWLDRFLAATVAFGHPGYLVMEGGIGNALRSYYMLQQIQSRYTTESAKDIRYVTDTGKLVNTSTAVAQGVHRRSQVVTTYSGGTCTVVNGSRSDRLRTFVDGKVIDLPPNGYAGWTQDGSVTVFSGELDGSRSDYAETPAYLYIDGRGRFTRHERAAGDGIGICRSLGSNEFEIIPYKNAECGFSIPSTRAIALNQENIEIGPAVLRRSRGFVYVEPVKGAFSYRLSGSAGVESLKCSRDRVKPGETVMVKGQREHRVEIPIDSKSGQHLWVRFEEGWIDFIIDGNP